MMHTKSKQQHWRFQVNSWWIAGKKSGSKFLVDSCWDLAAMTLGSAGYIYIVFLKSTASSKIVVIETYFKSTLRVAGHVGSNLASCRWTVTRLSLCSAAQRAVSWNYWQTAAMLVFLFFFVLFWFLCVFAMLQGSGSAAAWRISHNPISYFFPVSRQCAGQRT